jgi:hypothetical protein
MSFPILHFPDAHFPDAHFPHEAVTVIRQGGGGGKKKRPIKSWDQRNRERLEQERLGREAVQARLDRERQEKYGDLPKTLETALEETQTAAKATALKQQILSAQAERDAQLVAALLADDEEALALILECI